MSDLTPAALAAGRELLERIEATKCRANDKLTRRDVLRLEHELRDLLLDHAPALLSAAARLSTAEKALASMEAAALAYQELATCYRVGKNPSESLHTRLEHAEAALAAIKEPGK